MAVPQVAIVGRPNVGKSSLFNWLAGRRIAIVDPTAGVTRDRLATLIKADDRFFELIDTGGVGVQDVDNLTVQIERQIEAAIQEAAVILFVLFRYQPATTVPGLYIVLTGVPIYFLWKIFGKAPSSTETNADRT